MSVTWILNAVSSPELMLAGVGKARKRDCCYGHYDHFSRQVGRPVGGFKYPGRRQNDGTYSGDVPFGADLIEFAVGGAHDKTGGYTHGRAVDGPIELHVAEARIAPGGVAYAHVREPRLQAVRRDRGGFGAGFETAWSRPVDLV
ncbi:MAG: hypothetical protein HC902_10860 [Calothrix sp. SM1_5_4]|nr:hypothetical protein [Calothrix sp. SM1_5_4]